MTNSGLFSRVVPRPKASCFYGWTIVATAALGLFLGSFPIVVFSFGVFFDSFAQEFKAGRAAISFAFTLLNFNSGILSVVIGRLCDRFGARRVILPGLIILGVVLLLAETVGSRLWQLYLFYAVLGLVTPATTSVPYSLVVSRWFNRRRGLALGLMMAGLGIGAVVMPPMAQRLIAAFGWRSAFAIVGCSVLLLPIPIVGVFLKETPDRIGLLPDELSQTSAPALVDGRPEGLCWQEIWRRRTFWVMIAAFVMLAASVNGCIIHMPAIFGDRGASAKVAALVSSTVGFGVLIGRIGCGYFLDRYFGPYVAILISVHAAAGIVLLSMDSGVAFGLAGAFLVGLGMGAEVDIMAFLMSRYFGLRAFGTAFGFGFGALVLAAGLGPLVMGAGFDLTGSYRASLVGFFLATLAASVLLSRIGPYRYGTPVSVEGQVTELRAEV